MRLSVHPLLPPLARAPGDASSSAAVRDYDDLIATYIKPLAAVTQKIGSDELKAQIALIEKLVDSQRNFIATAAASKKPDAGAIEKLLAPSVGIIGEITALRDKNRTSKQFNHLSAISEGVPAFGWVVVVSIFFFPRLFLSKEFLWTLFPYFVYSKRLTYLCLM